MSDEDTENIRKYIAGQRTRHLEQMADQRKNSMKNMGLLCQEYDIFKVTVDLIEDELFTRSIMGLDW